MNESLPAKPAPLPSLFSNNSIENFSAPSVRVRKSASVLAWNVAYMAERYGLERLMFGTITSPDYVGDLREWNRRFNSLRSNVIRPRYTASIRVHERCVSGRAHTHVLVAGSADYRTGFDFGAIGHDDWRDNDYSSANSALRAEWAFWREVSERYKGFGRTEWLPIRSTVEGIGRYIGKYLGKHNAVRRSDDVGARLIGYSGDSRYAGTRFSWVTPGALSWRRKLAVFAAIMSELHDYPEMGLEELTEHLGPSWAHTYRSWIASLPETARVLNRASFVETTDTETGEIIDVRMIREQF